MSENVMSKSQMKKNAKKAEKAASKATESSAVVQPTQDNDATTTEESIPKSEGTGVDGSVVVVRNLKVNDAASAKVVWASLSCQVPIRVEPPVKEEETLALLVDGEIVSGGGNAMALTLGLLAANRPKMTITEQLLQDEWCEWERLVLRQAKAGNSLNSAWNRLNQSLTSSSGSSVCGSTLNIADIVILSTIYTLFSSPDLVLPLAVKHYVQAHSVSWQKVQSTLNEHVQQQQAPQPLSPGKTTITPTLDLDLKQPSLVQLVDSLFRQILKQLFGPNLELPTTIVTRCASPKHGDYQCSAAMPAFASLKKTATNSSAWKSPPMVAQAVVNAIGTDNPVITDLNVNGPGFISCRIRASLLENHVQNFLQRGTLPLPQDIQPQTCVVDFSSPNIAKEMHVGHLRSTIIGESVCRILELMGHKVHRINHLGDWGTQFGMLIQYLKEEFPEVASSTDSSNVPMDITNLTEFYKNAKKRFDESPDFKKQSQLNVVQLQSGDADCFRIWKLLCDISRSEFSRVYHRLDVTLEECGESFYNDKIPAVIEEFAKAGLLKEEEGGAKLVFTKESPTPLMLQKTDGGFGYDSTDMAALKYRLHVLKADRVIYITDFTQGDHFKIVFAAGHEIGWVDRGQRLQHIGFGTVQGEDGKRFRTRSGDTVRLVDLLDEAASRLEASLKQRIQDGASHISEQEAHEVAEAIGYGSVKYFDLRRNPTSNYKFSYDMMLDTKGDTGVYLLYARVRLESILAKAQEEHGVDLNNLGTVSITHESERNLALCLQQFPDVLTVTLDDLFPYHVCQYVYDLANAATDFVTKCRVLGSPEMSSRLLLCQATVLAMKQSFDLLGIRHVKRI